MSQFTASQIQTAQQVLAAVPQATPAEKLALMEAGLVESGMQNLPGGDRDSAGVFQERPSQGWKDVTNVTAATQQIYAAMNKSLQGDPGAMAQSAERSAFPGKYDAEQTQAEALLTAAGQGQVGTSAGSTSLTASSGTGLIGWIQGSAFRFGIIIFGAAVMLLGVWIMLGHQPMQIIEEVKGNGKR
jgi:hypothetical protein